MRESLETVKCKSFRRLRGSLFPDREVFSAAVGARNFFKIWRDWSLNVLYRVLMALFVVSRIMHK